MSDTFGLGSSLISVLPNRLWVTRFRGCHSTHCKLNGESDTRHRSNKYLPSVVRSLGQYPVQQITSCASNPIRSLDSEVEVIGNHGSMTVFLEWASPGPA